MTYNEQLKALVLPDLEKMKLMGGLIALLSFLKRGRREGGAEHFYLIPSDKIHRNDSKLHQIRFRLDIRKHFFTERGGEILERVS